MKLVSWNVNGLRACVKKGFMDYFKSVDADVFCVQETKLQAGQIELDLDGYFQYWNYAEKKGYSGTAVFTKTEPMSVRYGLGEAESEPEGRILTLEFQDFYLINVYTPNSQRELARLDYRMVWEDLFRKHVKQYDEIKPVVICGDLNVAHREIDLKNPKSNRKNAGFTDQERGKLTELIDSGFADSFRKLNPELEGAYTWWSYMRKARENNSGWRIDYFLVSEKIEQKIVGVEIHSEIMGSDHCPVTIKLEI